MPSKYSQTKHLSLTITAEQHRFIVNSVSRRKRWGWDITKSEFIRALIDKERREFDRIQQAKQQVEMDRLLEDDKL